MNSALLTGLLGVALGMRHALEPDHLAAVSTLAAEQKSTRASMTLGALWGFGHSFSLLLVGGSLALLEQQMPSRVANGFELMVAVVIVLLGVRALHKAWSEGRQGLMAAHSHSSLTHVHAAPVEHIHVSRFTLATRPLLIGILHGLAGSGALTAMVISHLNSGAARLGYIALFGVGSMVGMALLTGLVGASLSKFVKAPRVAAALLGIAGLASLVIGVAWGIEATSHLLGA